ncbi:MAG: nucleotidyltransferase family protein [Rhodobacterales bacterium]
MQPDKAMVFAAGFGTRMGDLTKTMPKPMVPVLGRPMIDHALAVLPDAGVKDIFVNTHHFANQLEDHLKAFPFVTAIREWPTLLETGGGLKNALPLIGNAPVFTLNCDALWLGENPVTHLAKAWNPDEMDGLLLILKRENALGYIGAGDFFLTDANRLERKGTRDLAPYLYTGVQIIKTGLLKTIKQETFSLNLLWQEMLAKQRLFGAVYDGPWIDTGHPEGIRIATETAADV